MTVNKEKCLELAQAIEDEGRVSYFDMGSYIKRNHEVTDLTVWLRGATLCNSVCCMAGTAALLWELPGIDTDHSFAVHKSAAEALGITLKQADKLFTPCDHFLETGYRHYESIPRAHAVAVLRHLARTGQVSWKRSWKDVQE